ncbi:MAG: type II and III secretion system protein family protein [Gammaproteobacteria bacterium]|nr:type II and III secretion system protein family protein [Gammaproteobacteria bacterium]
MSRFISLTLAGLIIVGLLSQSTLALTLTVNEGRLIQLPGKAKTVFVANEKIANYQIPAADKIFVLGKRAGSTNLYVLDARGRVIYEDKLRVQHDVKELSDQINQMYPDARITPLSNNGQLILRGTVSTPIIANNILELAGSYMSNIRYDQNNDIVGLINQLTVTLPNQVNIRVRIAEVSRQVTTALGLRGDNGFAGMQTNAWSVGGDKISSLNVNSALKKVIGSDIAGTINKIFGLKLNSHSIMLDALAQEGAAKLLAEPNLTALSGETATFLAGGEFPIPVSANALGQVLVTYKKYGVQLNITPTVLSDRRISLQIEPEVSSLDANGGVSMNGITIPGIKVRRTKTTIELASGESFMLAGLLTNDETNNISKFPFLGDIPVLGALFRSTGFNRKETELVIIAEAYIVEPSRSDQLSLPTDHILPLSDLERLLNINWQHSDQTLPLIISDDKPRLLGDNGFYY